MRRADRLATAPVNAAEVWNANASNVTGWNLSGFGATTTLPMTIEGTSFYTCPDGTTRTFGLLSESFNFAVDELEANVATRPSRS